MPTTAGSRGRRCVEPALELAHTGVEHDRAQRFLLEILVPILERTPEGRDVYGSRTRARRPTAWCAWLELLRDEGAAAVAELLPELAADSPRTG